MTDELDAAALMQELLSGLGVHNLSDQGKNLVRQRIQDYGRTQRRQAFEEAATIAEQYVIYRRPVLEVPTILGNPIAKAIRQQAREEG